MRTYAVTAQVSASAAIDLLRITPPLTGVMRVAEVHVTNEDVDTQEMVAIAVYEASTAGGAGTGTPMVALDPSDPATTGSAQYALSSIATKQQAFNREGVSIANGYHYIPLKKSRPLVSQGRHFVCRLESAPSAPLTLAVTAVVVEDG